MNEPLRLFVIEDDPEAALLVRRHLERAGHAVTTCRSGADALIVLGHTPFDLVLLGPRLPDMSGLDFLHSLTHEGIAVLALVAIVHAFHLVNVVEPADDVGSPEGVAGLDLLAVQLLDETDVAGDEM